MIAADLTGEQERRAPFDVPARLERLRRRMSVADFDLPAEAERRRARFRGAGLQMRKGRRQDTAGHAGGRTTQYELPPERLSEADCDAVIARVREAQGAPGRLVGREIDETQEPSRTERLREGTDG